jgi:ferritin-like metal-binding protein YciE
MSVEAIEHRVNTLETNHLSFIHELRQTNATLVKIEQAIEKQNEIQTDIRLLRQEFKSHHELELESTKRQNERIEKVENNLSRIAWMVITAVIVALLATVVKANGV